MQLYFLIDLNTIIAFKFFNLFFCQHVLYEAFTGQYTSPLKQKWLNCPTIIRIVPEAVIVCGCSVFKCFFICSVVISSSVFLLSGWVRNHYQWLCSLWLLEFICCLLPLTPNHTCKYIHVCIHTVWYGVSVSRLTENESNLIIDLSFKSFFKQKSTCIFGFWTI